jgi:hypothetical protein
MQTYMIREIGPPQPTAIDKNERATHPVGRPTHAENPRCFLVLSLRNQPVVIDAKQLRYRSLTPTSRNVVRPGPTKT